MTDEFTARNAELVELQTKLSNCQVDVQRLTAAVDNLMSVINQRRFIEENKNPENAKATVLEALLGSAAAKEPEEKHEDQ
jgi:uncharacterized protein YlxW (UPF0749 family)